MPTTRVLTPTSRLLPWLLAALLAQPACKSDPDPDPDDTNDTDDTHTGLDTDTTLDNGIELLGDCSEFAGLDAVHRCTEDRKMIVECTLSGAQYVWAAVEQCPQQGEHALSMCYEESYGYYEEWYAECGCATPNEPATCTENGGSAQITQCMLGYYYEVAPHWYTQYSDPEEFILNSLQNDAECNYQDLLGATSENPCSCGGTPEAPTIECACTPGATVCSDRCWDDGAGLTRPGVWSCSADGDHWTSRHAEYGAEDACYSPTEDADEDGYRVAEDCDDLHEATHPGAHDVAFDGIDQDCDGHDSADGDGDGYDSDKFGGTDCDDSDDRISPDARDIPNDGIDQDCSGHDAVDADRDGYLSDQFGGDDCNDADGTIHPGTPDLTVDGIDQNCDGKDRGEICDVLDWHDEDQDGLANCRDPDCANVAPCNLPEICDDFDWNDEDYDGDHNCYDSDCASEPQCNLPEICDDPDEWDEDYDGDYNCYDADCALEPHCNLPEICDDPGWDDEDYDGDYNCYDADCEGHRNCNVALYAETGTAVISTSNWVGTSSTGWRSGFPWLGPITLQKYRTSNPACVVEYPTVGVPHAVPCPDCEFAFDVTFGQKGAPQGSNCTDWNVDQFANNSYGYGYNPAYAYGNTTFPALMYYAQGEWHLGRGLVWDAAFDGTTFEYAFATDVAYYY